MTYLDYIVYFQKLDSANRFSPGATRLYLKLLYVANLIADSGPWPTQFTKSNPEMVGLCGGAENSFRGYRDELEKRGLIATATGGQGPKAVTIYQLLSSSKGAKSEPSKGANSEPSEAQNDAKGSDKGAGKGSKFAPPIYKEEEREKEKGAATTASPPASFSVEGSKKSKSTASKKKAAAQAEEVAALTLPFDGELFAQRWTTFRTGPKQAKKPLSAFELMLTKLGKYPEAFAVEMLEAAIQGDWSGVENDGTGRKYAEWQAQQACRPAPIAAGSSPTSYNKATLFAWKPPADFNPSAQFYPTGPPPPSLADVLTPEAVAEKKARQHEDMTRRADALKQKQATPPSEPTDTP